MQSARFGKGASDESRKADTQIGAQKTAELGLVRNLAQLAPEPQQNEQERQLHAQERYIEPPLEQATQNLKEDLNELNPRIENKEFMPQLLSLFEKARTKTGEAAFQARATLTAGIDLLKKTKEIKLTPPWQNQISSFVSLAKQQNAEPENKEIAEQARMRAGVVAENHSMYLGLQNETKIPKEKIDGFMDRRAATEAKSNKKRQFVALPS
jgi:hypothetical protein